MYGIPNTIDQIESNSALVVQLKNLLQNALDRENHLANFIQKLCNEDLAYLSKKFENLKIADIKIRENSERLLMRNEELETRLLDAQSKLWTLKLMYEEYDHIINEMAIHKEENQYIHKENKSEIVGAVDDFLSIHGLSRKKSKSGKSKSALSSQIGKSSLNKKQSVRFKKSLGRAGASDQFSDSVHPRSKAALLRRMTSRGSKTSLRRNRSEAVRLGGIQTEPREETKSRQGVSRKFEMQGSRSASIQPGLRKQRTGGQSVASSSRGGRKAEIQPSFGDYVNKEGIQADQFDEQEMRNQQMSFGPRQVSEGIQPSIHDQRSAGIQPSFHDQRSVGVQPSLYDQRSAGVQPSRYDQRSAGVQPSMGGRGSRESLQDEEFKDQRSGGIHPSRQSDEGMHYDPNTSVEQPLFTSGMDPSPMGARSYGGRQGDSREARGQIVSGERTPANPHLPILESRGGSQRSNELISNQDRSVRFQDRPGLSPVPPSRGYPKSKFRGGQGQREYDQEDTYEDGLGDINEEYYDDEGEYGEGEEEESEDEDNIDTKSIFDEAHQYIEDLKSQIKDGEDIIENNNQNIDSLSKELDELKKINDRLENQLYKYQYDINRITDVLMNDSHPTAEELASEEQDVEEMTDQEKHLYLLLKK
jgi:hypothetical protein